MDHLLVITGEQQFIWPADVAQNPLVAVDREIFSVLGKCKRAAGMHNQFIAIA